MRATRRTTLLALVAAVALAAGCAHTPEARRAQVLHAAYASYTETGEQLLQARAAGLIGDEDWQVVQAADGAAWQALEAWNKARVSGMPTYQEAADLHEALDDLVGVLIRARAPDGEEADDG